MTSTTQRAAKTDIGITCKMNHVTTFSIKRKVSVMQVAGYATDVRLSHGKFTGLRRDFDG